METKKHIAAEKKRCNSHNCAQAILLTYADVAGLSEDDAMNIANRMLGKGYLTNFCVLVQ
jgi:hypothetical protein